MARAAGRKTANRALAPEEVTSVLLSNARNPFTRNSGRNATALVGRRRHPRIPPKHGRRAGPLQLVRNRRQTVEICARIRSNSHGDAEAGQMGVPVQVESHAM